MGDMLSGWRRLSGHGSFHILSLSGGGYGLLAGKNLKDRERQLRRLYRAEDQWRSRGRNGVSVCSAISVLQDFEEKPYALLTFVNPVFQKAGRCYVSVLVAHGMQVTQSRN